MERPDLLVELAEKHGARDTTARGHVMEELKKVTPRRSQFQPGDEIPERSFVYRWAKRYAFNDFGTYSRHFEMSNYQDPDASGSPSAPAQGAKPSSASDLPIVSQ